MADANASEREEIRFAVVLNGGVSLAVWMGGVACELDALIRADGGFGLLMEQLRVRARADVISGTSAGGINGAALALSQVNQNANLSVLRDLWADQGRMETLLQRPFRGEPASLLRGEAYFLPELTNAMQQLVANWNPAPIDQRPMDLIVNTTLLDGALWETTDGFGQRLTQRRHDGQFRFVRMLTDSGRETDQFDPDSVAARLGLAARASAGFPVAFEPTYIPVDAPEGSAQTAGRPDMAEHANWRMRVPDGGLRDRSRYAVDGGLLANTPTRPALEAVQRMRADRNVERVLTLISPRGAADQDGSAAAFASPPTLLRSGLGMMSALTSQGNRSFVDEVEEHNRRVQARRGTRSEVLASLGQGDVEAADAVEQLRATATSVFPFYRDLRRRRVGREVASQAPRPEGWSDRRIHEEIDASRTADGLAVPYVPRAFTTEGRLPPVPDPEALWPWGWETVLDIADIALDYLDALGRVWPVGPAALGRARSDVHNATAHARYLRDAYQRVWDEPLALMPDEYVRLRRVAYQWLMHGKPDAALEALEGFGPAVVSELAPLAAGLLRADHRDDPPDGASALAVLTLAGGTGGRLLATAASAVLDAVLAPTTRGSLTPYERTVLKWSFDEPWRRISEAATSGPNSRRRTWAMLLALHVVSWTVGDEPPTANTREVKLALISAATTNHFATLSRSVEDKLGGASLSRFSGFLKQSWRMNDWTWGRCDAASMLTRILVTPERVLTFAAQSASRRTVEEYAARSGEARSTEADAEAVVNLLFAASLGLTDSAAAAATLVHPEVSAVLGPLRTGAVSEVTALLKKEKEQPAVLTGAEDQDAGPVIMPRLTDLLTYPRHALIAVQELRTIAASIRADQSDGASPGSHGELFLAENAELLRDLYAPPPAGSGEWLALGIKALRAFDRAGIGREPLEREAASDQIIRTAVTSAAVAATVLDGPHSGLRVSVTKPVTRGLKGLLMLPYWVTRGLTSTGTTARYLGLLGLAVGGVLLVLSVLGLIKDEAAGVAALLGGGALLTAVAYAALRSGSHLHAGVLAAGVVLLPALGLFTDTPERSASVVVVGLIVLGGLILLGSLQIRVQVPEDDLPEPGVGRGGRAWRRVLRVLVTGGSGPVLAVTFGVFGWVAARNAARAQGGLDVLAADSVLPMIWPGRTGERFGWDAAIGVAIAAVVLVAVLLTRLQLRSLGRWDGPTLRRYAGAAAATTRWSLGDGLLFGGFAIAVLGWWQAYAHVWTLWALIGGLGALAMTLLLVLPGLVIRATRSRIHRRTRSQAIYALSLGSGTQPGQDIEAMLRTWLVGGDRAYRFLVRRPQPPTLARAGRAMAAELADPTTG